MKPKGGTPAHLDATMRLTFGVEIGSSPKTGIVQDSYESFGNTDSSSRATTILAVPNVYVLRHAGAVTQVFDFADSYVETGENSRQENWKEGLFINYQYIGPGIANLIIVICNENVKQRYFRVLMRLSRRPLEDIQGVLL